MDAIHAKPLPLRPNLEQYKKQAKDLLRACKAGDTEALRRINDQWPDFGPASATRTAEGCVLADAQHTIAREHGFLSWPRFSKHLRGLEHGEVRDFETAVDAIVGGDLATLGSLLDDNPALVRQRSTRTHGAALLHYVAANGVENYRQKTPANAVEIADLLLGRGAEPDATATMYGGDATTLEMLVSSQHPADAGVQVALVDKLVDFGAAVDGPKNDGEPLLTAVLFQYARAAEALVRRGARVDSIVIAAGLGREDLVRSFVADDGSLRPEVRLVTIRAPRVRRDARANLEWALVCAAALGHTAVVEFLADRGVDPGVRGFAGLTALHWAAAAADLPLVDLLLARHAPLEDRDNHHHATVLGCALWAATKDSPPPDALRTVERLLEAGARTDAVEFPTGNDAVDEVLRARAG